MAGEDGIRIPSLTVVSVTSGLCIRHHSQAVSLMPSLFITRMITLPGIVKIQEYRELNPSRRRCYHFGTSLPLEAQQKISERSDLPRLDMGSGLYLDTGVYEPQCN
jgi:hypothetical protein